MEDVAVSVEPASEQDWFDGLYRAHWDGMVRLAFVMVDDLAVAEELTQDVFARVYRARATVQEPLAYLRSAIYNACRNHHRNQRRQRRRPLQHDPATAPVGDHVIDVVRRLPDQQRALVVLRYYSNLTDPEIASATGLPLGTVKSTLFRALAELRKELL